MKSKSHVVLYDGKTIDTLPWTETTSSQFSRAFLPPLMKEGVESYIGNIKTSLFALKVDDEVLPVTVNEKEYQNAYSVSSYYVIHEWASSLQKKNAFLRGCQTPFLEAASSLLKWLKVNKVVIVNNWFFTTTVYPNLTINQIREATSLLTKQFPDHLIMFRSVNTLLGDEFYQHLKECGYRMLPSRKIFAYDPERLKTLPSFYRRKQKKDLNLFKRNNYEVITQDEISEEELPRLVELYKMVYIDKYTPYAPHYTVKFLKHLFDQKILKFKALKKDGKIYGVMGQLHREKELLTPFFGYDTSLPSDEGLYRMLSILAIEESNKTGRISNYSSGAASYKEWRGMELTQEFFALYDRHLPLHRKSVGFLSEKIMRYKTR